MSCTEASRFDAKTMPRDVVRRAIVRASTEPRAKNRSAGLSSMCETCAMLIGFGCSRRLIIAWSRLRPIGCTPL
eukprot:6130973-Pleurochrysis_carterae.AAC.1